jgi:RNA binding exosome subunit
MDIPLIEINANVNATESPSKVKKTLLFLFPSGEIHSITTDSVKGGYGNPIVTLKVSLKNNKENIKILSHIASKISFQDKKAIKKQLFRRINSRGVLFLRFSKKDLAIGKISLTNQSDSIRIQVKIGSHNKKFDIKKLLPELQEFLFGIGLIENS